MSRQAEGVNASYVGWETDGLQSGDRCFVLSDEGSHVHVRWTSGAKAGQYDMVKAGHLVFDASSAPPDDEFGFEVDPRRLVSVACREVLDRGGSPALFQALEESGHLESIARCTRVALVQIREAISNDPAWKQVMGDLGQDADRITREAIKFAAVAILENEVDDDDVD